MYRVYCFVVYYIVKINKGLADMPTTFTFATRSHSQSYLSHAVCIGVRVLIHQDIGTVNDTCELYFSIFLPFDKSMILACATLRLIPIPA